LTEQWCIPTADAAFVWPMEDVLDVYTRPYDPRRPQVCLDETSRQLLADTREPRPMVPSHPTAPTAAPGPAGADTGGPPALVPGHPKREDHEYERCGVANLFMTCEPLRGKRQVRVSDQRTRVDFAYCIKDLVDVHYPDAEVIVLVMDNLNTHTPASRYEAFEPAEAKRLADKLEIHYTPQHGSCQALARN
jgi:DDE superfamily endonuclease